MKTKRIKAPALENRDQFIATVDRIATLQGAIDLVEAQQTMEEQRIKAIFADAIKPLQEELNAKATLAEKYAADNRGLLFAKDRKSETTALATFGFREGNPSTATRSKWTWEKAVEALREHELTAYLIPMWAPAKAKILADGKDGTLTNKYGESIALAEVGIRIDQDETFFIEPKGETGKTVHAQAVEETGRK